MGKGRIAHFGFSAAIDIFTAEPVPYKGKHLGIDNHLRNVAIREGLPALSSPMVGEFWKAIILLKRQYLRAGKWKDYPKLRHASFQAYFNPKVVDASAQNEEEWEECCGYPGLRLSIPRPKKLILNYRQEEKFEQKTEQFVGFAARLLLHQLDHIDCIDPLKVASKIEIIDPQLKQQHDGMIQGLFETMLSQRQEEENPYKRTPQFNQLRREIAYCITEHYRN